MGRSMPTLFAACALLAAVHAPREALGAPLTFIGSWSSTGIPCGLAVGPGGTLYLGDEWNDVGIRAFSPGGVSLGTFSPGDPIETYGIAFLSDQSIIFADYYGKRVLRYAPDGTYLSQFATGGVVSSWLAVDESDHIYVVDDNGGVIRKFTSTGALITQWPVNHPAGIAYTEGKVFVTEMWAGHINIYTPDGVPLGSFANGATWAEQLSANGTGLLFLGDHGTHQLKCFSTAGVPQWTLGPTVPGYPFASADLFSVAQAPDGTLFVGDFNNRNVLIFVPGPTAAAHDTFGALKARYRN